MRRSGAVYAIFLLLATLLNVVPSLTTSAIAEPYLALQLGAALPNKLSNVEGTGGLSGVTVGDLDVKSSFMFGAKAGYFFQSLKWLGVEIESLSYPRFCGHLIRGHVGEPRTLPG